MADLKLQVKLDAPKIEIQGLQDKIQAQFNSKPINVKFDVDTSTAGAKASASFKKITADAASATQATRNLKREFAQNEHVDRALANLNRYYDKYRSQIESNSVLLNQFQKLQEKVRSDGYGDFGAPDGLAWRNLSADIAKFTRNAQEAGIEVVSLSDRIQRLFSAHLGTAMVMLAINGLRKGVQEVWTNAKELDQAVVNLGVASGLSRTEVQGLVKEYSELGKAIGATTVQVADSADTWLRQGYSLQEANKLIRDTMMLSKLGQLDSASAATALTSAMKGYKLSVEDATDIVSRFVAVDMEAAVTAGGLATALSETAVSASIAGVSLDRIIGYIAKVSEVTQDGAESVGEGRLAA